MCDFPLLAEQSNKPKKPPVRISEILQQYSPTNVEYLGDIVFEVIKCLTVTATFAHAPNAQICRHSYARPAARLPLLLDPKT